MREGFFIRFELLPQRCGYEESQRTCLEKRIAAVLVLGGIESLLPKVSACHDHPNKFSGLYINRGSLVARPYIEYKDDPLLWAVLRKCGINFSGCGNSRHEPTGMQANWRPESQPEHTEARTLDPLIICAYFAEIKRLGDLGKLEW